MKRFPGPTQGPESWRQWLADPERHWREGYSAWTLAHCWEAASGFPSEISALLATDPQLAGIELLAAIPEYQVALPGGERPSQNDLFCLGRTDAGLAAITVEGKVDESFGETLDVWRKEASSGKKERLDFLVGTLGLGAVPPGAIRYQLLHRTASAVIEANRFHAHQAVMIVHHFSREGASGDSFADFVRFAGLFDRNVEPGRLVALGEPGGVRLSVGWATGRLD